MLKYLFWCYINPIESQRIRFCDLFFPANRNFLMLLNFVNRLIFLTDQLLIHLLEAVVIYFLFTYLQFSTERENWLSSFGASYKISKKKQIINLVERKPTLPFIWQLFTWSVVVISMDSKLLLVFSPYESIYNVYLFVYPIYDSSLYIYYRFQSTWLENRKHLSIETYCFYFTVIFFRLEYKQGCSKEESISFASCVNSFEDNNGSRNAIISFGFYS